MNTKNSHDLWEYLRAIPEPENAEEIAACAYSDAIDDIAIALTEYRIKHKLTQAELASRFGFSQSVLSGYENGSRNMSIEVACNLLAQIGIKLSLSFEKCNSGQIQDNASAFVVNGYLSTNKNVEDVSFAA